MAVRARSESCDSYIKKEPPYASDALDVSDNTENNIISASPAQENSAPNGPSNLPQISSSTPQVNGLLNPSNNAKKTDNNNPTIDVNSAADTISKPKINKGLLAQTKWQQLLERRKKKEKEEKVKKPYFSKRAVAAMKASSVTPSKKPKIQKKDTNKICKNTLIVLQAISYGKYDHLVTESEKAFIQRNSVFRAKLIRKLDNDITFKWKFIIYKRILKREWFEYEEKAVEILKTKNLDIELCAVMISLEERRNYFNDISNGINEILKRLEIRERVINESCKSYFDAENDDNRPMSGLSGGGPGDDGSYVSDSLSLTRSPSPFSNNSQDGDNESGSDMHDAINGSNDDFFDLNFNSPIPSPVHNVVNDGGAEVSDRESGELSTSDEEADFDYKSPNPARTSTKDGFYAENCFQRLSDKQYLNILTMENPDYCHGVYPHVFADGGTILIFNVEQVKLKWGLKNFSSAQSEVRCDAWSWSLSTGGKKRIQDGVYLFKVDHFRGRNAMTGKAEDKFSCWQYTTPDQKWQLLHYLGDNSEVAVGLPHGNSKNGKPYIRSCPSLLRNLMKDSVTDKPTNVYKNFYNGLEEEVAKNPQLQLVKGPRDATQIKNARSRALNWGRLSTNTIGNIAEISIRLVYPQYFIPKSETPRPFINALGLSPTNLFLYMENPMLFEEMGKIIKETGLIMRLQYDTTFKLGDFFLSILSWYHPIFKKNIIIAAYIHDSKDHDKHEDFFRKLWNSNKHYLAGGRFVLITDGEFHLSGVWPLLINLYCFLHLKKNLERKLRGRGQTYKEVCLQLITELQHQTSAEDFDLKLDECLAELDNDKVKQIFLYYAKKLKDRCSRWAIHEAGLNELVLMTQGAESLNAYIKRYKPKDSLFADEMVIILFYLMQDELTKIVKGYYRHPQGYEVSEMFLDKIRGKVSEMPSIAFVPGLNDIVSYIRDKSTLPLMPGMKESGPMVPYMGTENSNVLNAMARELVQRQRITRSQDDKRHFFVHDLSDVLAAVVVKDKDLSKLKYSCSCKSKNCIHLRAVFFYLGIRPGEIPFIAATDPLRALHANRRTNEKSAGDKTPRKGERSKDYLSDDDENMDDSITLNEDMQGTERGRSSQGNKRKKDDKDTDGQRKRRRQEEPTENIENQIAGWWDEIQANPETDLTEAEIQLRNDIKERFERSKNELTPPDLTISPPAYWQTLAENFEEILFFPQLFKPNFFNLLPVIPQKKAVIFATAGDNFALCYKASSTSLFVFAMDENLNFNTPEEMAFSASHCSRDETKVEITVYNSNDTGNKEHPLALVALKLMCLVNNENPQNFIFDLPEREEINYENLLQVYNNKTEGAADCFIRKKTYNFYCCCKRSSFEPTVGRNDYLMVPTMVQCSKAGCKKFFFSTCVNHIPHRRSRQPWYCCNCSGYRLPPVPSWGKGAHNTCPLDNILAALAVMVNQHPEFTRLLGSSNFFEQELRNFLVQKGNTEKSINDAKRNFVQKVYDRKNLYGTENMLILSRLLHVHGVITSYKCPKCDDETESTPQEKTHIRPVHIGLAVPNIIKSVISLENAFVTGARCNNNVEGQKCNEPLELQNFSFAQEYPWLLSIALANENLARDFGYNEIEQLPLVFEYQERQYQLGCITFHTPGHFVAVIPVEGGFAYYDGMDRIHTITTMPQALKKVAGKNAIMNHILYFLIPEKQNTTSQRSAKNTKGLEILATGNSGKVKVIAGDITSLKVDAIVNAAKQTLLGGGGLDGQIHAAAGPRLLQECKKLKECDVGEAKITKAYNIKTAKHIIHTVGPRISHKVTEDDEIYLYNCYLNSLNVAKENGLRSVAFPTISTGIYGYPKDAAALVATEAVKDFLQASKKIEEIIFCVCDKDDKRIYKNLIPRIFP